MGVYVSRVPFVCGFERKPKRKAKPMWGAQPKADTHVVCVMDSLANGKQCLEACEPGQPLDGFLLDSLWNQCPRPVKTSFLGATEKPGLC